MNEHFVEILKGLGLDDNIANNISDGIREKYLALINGMFMMILYFV